MMHELFADLRRWKSDKKVNNYMVTKLNKDGTETKIKAQDIKVGDILKLTHDSQIQADCLIL